MNNPLDYLTKIFPRKGNSWYKGLKTEKNKNVGVFKAARKPCRVKTVLGGEM